MSNIIRSHTQLRTHGYCQRRCHPGTPLAGINKDSATAVFSDPGQKIAGMTAFVALVFLSAIRCFGSGYEFEGIGAREVSRAGAAIADSANWTSIYWNPANARKAVESESANIGIEIFGGEAHGTDTNSLSSLPVGGFSQQHVSSPFVLGAAGATFKAGRFGLGVGFYTPLLQGVNFSDVSNSGVALDYEASAGILTTSLIAAMQVTSKLYVGAGLDLLYGRVEQQTEASPFLLPGNKTTSHLKGDGVAPEGILGIRYEPNEKWILGLVYRSGADVPIKGDATVNNTNPFIPNEATGFKYELRHPATSGLGVAYKPGKWSFHGDFTQTYWKRFSNEFQYDQDGTFLSDSPNTFDWRNTWKIRLGSGFQATEKTDLVFGYSYDRSALDADSVDIATTIDVPMNRFYFGMGHKWTDVVETILGGVYGKGQRSEAAANYRLEGWQLMLETQFRLGRKPA